MNKYDEMDDLDDIEDIDMYDSDDLDDSDDPDSDESDDFEEFIEREEAAGDYEDRFRVTKRKAVNKKNRNITIAIGVTVIVIIFLTVTVSLIAMIKKNTESSYNYNYQKAKEYYDSGKYNKAIPYYEKALAAISSSDRDNQIKLNMALFECYKQANLPNSQISALNSILNVDKYNETAVKEIAALYKETGNGDAINHLLQAYEKTSFEAFLEQYKVAVPSADVNSGSYEDDVVVTLSSSEEGVKIYYTIDGSEPTKYAPLYDGPITLSEGTVELKIVAINEIGVMSKSASYKYDIVHGAPQLATVNLPNGAYTSPRQIEITNIPEGGKAYYTWDGTNPTETSKQYDPEKKIDLKVGNNVLKIKIVNKYDIEGPVALYVYDLTLRGDYSLSAACDALSKKLVELKQIKGATELLDGTQFKYFEYNTEIVDDVYIYVVGVSAYNNGSYVKQSYYYGINSKTLELYTVSYDGEEKATFSPIK